MMKTILCVEDNPVFSEVLQSHLATSGHTVKMAADGTTGLKLAQEAPYDLIFLDVILPDIDGYEICATLRKSEAMKGIPIIMLTGEDQMGSVWTGMEKGATDYVSKGDDTDKVMARVDEMIEKYVGLH